MKDEKIIRKLYGEKMWHLCRSLFPTLLETEGLLTKLLQDHFNPSRFLYDDIVNNHMKFGDYFLYKNEGLTSFSAPNATSFGYNFLANNPELANKIINSINGGKTR